MVNSLEVYPLTSSLLMNRLLATKSKNKLLSFWDW